MTKPASHPSAISPNMTPSANRFLSLTELCRLLSISDATGRNWLRLGKLKPDAVDQDSPCFSGQYAARLLHELQTGKNTVLKSRRNKSYVSGHALYRSYLSEHSRSLPAVRTLLSFSCLEQALLVPNAIRFLLADCALKLFFSRHALSAETFCSSISSLFACYLSNPDALPIAHGFRTLADDLIADLADARAFANTYPELFSVSYDYEPGEDLLGLIYLSCHQAGNRKAAGSYYTPSAVVRKVIAPLFSSENTPDAQAKRSFYDPCCGSGSFLLQLPDSIRPEQIFGTDLDEISIAAARLSLALKFPDTDAALIRSHVTAANFLTVPFSERFPSLNLKDVRITDIIGNPPWGYQFSPEEKSVLKTRFQTASQNAVESSCLFLEQALSELSVSSPKCSAKEGISALNPAVESHVAFVLPEAILTVKTHAAVRRLLLENASIRRLEYLGNVFDGVQCPCIILHLTRTSQPFSPVGMTVCHPDRHYTIQTDHRCSPEQFLLSCSDPEYAVLEAMKARPEVSFLAGQADFAMGIVTGNNKKFLFSKPSGQSEPIIRGTDLKRYRIHPPACYTIFQPECFQQAAPASVYRTPEKLLYRFISSRPVFAYDNAGRISLNSCNLLIPRMPGMRTKYILAVLNSSAVWFFWRCSFRSVKMLRSHLESIPIPFAPDPVQLQICELTDRLAAETDPAAFAALDARLDALIFDRFGLNAEERQVVLHAIANAD